MTLFNRKVDYALLILSYLYRKAEGACAREIADRFELSRAFVANILKELCHKGFVSSHRGVKGGYVTVRPAASVSLAEVIDALDDSFRIAECMPSAARTDRCTIMHLCPVRAPLAEVHDRIRAVLQNVTLAEIIRPPETPLSPLPADGLQLGLSILALDHAGVGSS